MSNGRTHVGVEVGDGLVARFGDVIVLVADPSRYADAVEGLLDAVEAAASGPTPGPAVAARLARLVAGAEGSAVPSFGAVAPTEGGYVVLLRGSVWAETVSGGTAERLSGDQALTWVDRLLPTPVDKLTVGSGDHSVSVDPRSDLRAGLVPGSGFILTPARGAPGYASAGGAPAVAVAEPGQWSAPAQSQPVATAPGPDISSDARAETDVAAPEDLVAPAGTDAPQDVAGTDAVFTEAAVVVEPESVAAVVVEPEPEPVLEPEPEAVEPQAFEPEPEPEPEAVAPEPEPEPAEPQAEAEPEVQPEASPVEPAFAQEVSPSEDGHEQLEPEPVEAALAEPEPLAVGTETAPDPSAAQPEAIYEAPSQPDPIAAAAFAAPGMYGAAPVAAEPSAASAPTTAEAPTTADAPTMAQPSTEADAGAQLRWGAETAPAAASTNVENAQYAANPQYTANPQYAANPQAEAQPRPAGSWPMGALVGTDGTRLPLDRSYVLGREPDHDPAVLSGAATPIRLADEENLISRVQSYITVEAGQVALRDASSANGTYVAAPGAPTWTRLGPDPVLLPPTWSMRVGNRVFTYMTGP